MNNNEIKELIHLIDQSSLKYFELENSSVSLKLSKRESDIVNVTQDNSTEDQNDSLHETLNNSEVKKQSNENNSNAVNNIEEDQSADEAFHKIKSPIVGTSYRSSSPDSPDFVKVGDLVDAGQTILIIEAMKVMNEIKSDVSGVIEEILIEDGQAIEFDQALIKINVN
ncbi:acetyl-CoA carboxylase biotin carboxyl carrier protein [Alkalibacterium sp. f15]|uniref:acetyl-CoA carboxylase biotin carboxyl carrier protein n=1 Tax=Alkalibacterium sp. f15 TaxID=3414029 RepID=UPI003BF827A1